MPLGKLERAIETFKKSLAGYCVITYILGIGNTNEYLNNANKEIDTTKIL